MELFNTNYESVSSEPSIVRAIEGFMIVKMEKGNYFYYNKNEKKFLFTESRASKWRDYEAAFSAFKVLMKKLSSVTDVSKEMTVKDLNIATINTPENELISNYSQKFLEQDWQQSLEQIKLAITFLQHIPEIAKLLTKQIKHEEGIVLQDLLHVVELGDAKTAAKKAQVFDYLKNSRNKRRKTKDLLLVIEPLLMVMKMTTVNANIEIAKQTYQKIDGERTYDFRDEAVKRRFERYLEKDNDKQATENSQQLELLDPMRYGS